MKSIKRKMLTGIFLILFSLGLFASTLLLKNKCTDNALCGFGNFVLTFAIIAPFSIVLIVVGFSLFSKNYRLLKKKRLSNQDKTNSNIIH